MKMTYHRFGGTRLLSTIALALSLSLGLVTTDALAGGDGAAGGKTWCDNGDGIQSRDEHAMGGMKIKMLRYNRGQYNRHETQSDDQGQYKFDELPVDDWYIVQYEQDDDYPFAPAEMGDDDANDSDARSQGYGRWFKLTGSNPTNYKNDAGYMHCPPPPPLDCKKDPKNPDCEPLPPLDCEKDPTNPDCGTPPSHCMFSGLNKTMDICGASKAGGFQGSCRLKLKIMPPCFS